VTADEKKYLGPYRLDAKLGEGGMGVVYRAVDEQLHREVAIKVLHPHLLQNENLKERFRREARMHAQLMHPNVVTLLSLFEDNGHMALVMEMVHGRNLKEYLKTHSGMTLQEVIDIAKAVLSGLGASHQLGMVHRDLKPANVLLSEDGAIKLMDFGLAKPKTGDDDLTQSGATVGSFRYMAPEQILNQPVDARTDLYAFGILLYQMVTGKLPFDASAKGGGEFEIMEKQVREDPVPPVQLMPALPQEMSDLIMRLLSKSPAERPATCGEVKTSLDAIGESAQTGSKVPRQAPRPRPMPEVHSHSNIEIAKGLVTAAWRSTSGMLTTVWRKSTAWFAPVTAWATRGVGNTLSRVPGSEHIAERWQHEMSQRTKGALTWAGLLLFVALLGWILVGVIQLAERPASAPELTPAASESPAAEQPKVEPKAEPAPVAKPEPKAEPKPVAKPKVVAKPQPKPKPRPRPRPTPSVKSVTYSVDHKVVRSDFSRAGPNDRHAFRGGSRLWFDELRDYPFKERIRTFKKGWIRLYLDKPVNLSKIIIHKASVGRRSFSGGEISLEVQDDKGHWTDVFVRKDDDVDIPVTITRPVSALNHVKGVRLRFKTPEPITIGPIDLLP